MPLLGAGHGRIELDQDLAGLDPLPVADMDRAHHTGLEGLDQLGAAARDDLALCRRHDVDAADAGQPSARQKAQMMIAAVARTVGDGGVSVISSAAGSKASS